MIRVTRGLSVAAWIRCGLGADFTSGALSDVAPTGPSAASRRIIRTSSSTERPAWRAQPEAGLEVFIELSDGQTGHGEVPCAAGDLSK
jgi:hypothetical protein